MWRLGFFLHEIAFGLLSVFLPLYVIAVGGSLFDIGVMSSSALFLAIPFSFLWGYLCDRIMRYKRFVLLSFAALSILLYFFTFTTRVELLILLYAFIGIFHVAHESPKNVLIAELYPREEWEKAYALYEVFVKLGWLIGIFAGFLISTFEFHARSTLLLCSGLDLAAFAFSLVFVKDPPLIFERSLVKIEKSVDFTYRGTALAAKFLDGIRTDERLRVENPYAFCIGLTLSSLATSMLSTPLPVFFSNDLAVPVNFVFAIYLLNSGGGVAGCLLALNKLHWQQEKSNLSRILMSRGIFTFLLMVAALMPLWGSTVASVIVMSLGFTHALFFIYTLSISMEIMPAGKAGFFNIMVNVGGALGSFIGPYAAQTIGFTYLFFIVGAAFILAYIAFKFFR